MSFKQRLGTSTRQVDKVLVVLFACAIAGVLCVDSVLADAVPERCEGYGALQSISRTDWESGLGSWTAGTQNIANPVTFATPNWAVAGGLPDGRPGMAAFVADLVLGDCAIEDQSAVLTLRSPSIAIPNGVEVPRISITHWFQTEFGWDGGNFKISVNGGPFVLIPPSAIAITPYNDTLYPPLDLFLLIYNTNPLADQIAFTGTHDGQPTGDWVQSRINLLGIANGGDSIRLRIEFGLDECTIADQVPAPVGWYIDEVEFYSCEAELPPSNCGNGKINGAEQCDDGNNFIGDGCSNNCKIETGWQCTAPTAAGTVSDPSFEAGRNNPYWDEVKNNAGGSPICSLALCGAGGGSGASDGTYWVWLGGIKPYQEGSVSQSMVIPTTVRELSFDFEIPRCDSASDYVEVLIDGNQVLLIDGSDPRCGFAGYQKQTADISAFADGGTHEIKIHSETFSNNGSVSNFFIDVVGLPGIPSICRRNGTSLTLQKKIINDDGGEALTSDWTLSATGPSSFSGPGPAVWGGAPFSAGTYDLSEAGGPSNYSANTWVCEGGTQIDGDTVSVALDEFVTCRITNDDTPPTLTVVNSIINNNGGDVTDPDTFGLRIDGVPAQYDVTHSVEIGDHTVSEVGLPGYAAGVWGGDCNPDGSITLSLGETATCTITHDDISPTLTVLKTIINDDDGTISDRNAFGLRVDGISILHGIPTAIDAGGHTVSEDGLPGYVPGMWSGDCDAAGNITLALAQNATCAITNNDSDRTSLTLVKQVINDNGGTALPSAWTLSAAGPSSFSGTGPSVYSGVAIGPGTYNLSQSASVSGYGSGSWVCVGGTQTDGDTVILALDETATCTITSNDIPPSLTVTKIIINNSGGSQIDPNVFGLRLDGNLIPAGALNLVNAGSHIVSEDGLPGYQAGIWGGDCSPDGSITVTLAESATCTITNDDLPATLTVMNNIVNDNGGTVTDSNSFGLRIDGVSVLNGVAKSLNAGIHTVSQLGRTGYLAGPWGGDCNPDGTISLSLGQAATCSITNDDISPTLKIVKNIVNDSGGTIDDPNAFGLKIDGNPVFHNAVNMVNAGSHVVSEVSQPGYVAGFWGGDCGHNGTINLALAQQAVCTITNDDSNNTSLTLVKNLTNNNGGTATGSSWTLTATGPSTLSGPGPYLSSGPGFLPGTYDLSENGPDGYAASPWICNGNSQVDTDTIVIGLGDDVECYIINDDIGPYLTVINSVINDNGGTATPNAFGLRVDGNAVSNNTPIYLSAGAHNVSADGLAGYQSSTWGGDCNPDGSISLALGDHATCTISNDDIAPTLKVFKNIVNNNGGTETNPDAFGLRIDGIGVLHNAVNTLHAGNHSVSEDGLEGYIQGVWSPPCNPDGTITLVLGQAATCSITNDDVATTSLTLAKQVINDNGGTALGSDWTLTADGPTGFSGNGPIVSSGPGFEAGTYALSESGGLPGYNASNWACVGGTQIGSSISLAPGQAATCTITNNDVDTTSLTLVKEVTNDNGGTAGPSAWTLSAIGPTQFSGSGPIVSNGPGFSAGVYDLFESGGPAEYSASAWVCDGGSQLDGDTISLALGEVVTCTITNNDIPPTLKVMKTIVNNNGGTVVDPNAFGLKIDNVSVLNNVINPVSAGNHVVSETGLPGYLPGLWGGDCNPDGSIGLGPGDNAVCSITNNDAVPVLTLINQVTNDNGGTAVAANWILTASGPTGFSGGGPSVSSGGGFAAGTYDLSASGPPGYTAGAWVCSGGVQNDTDTVTVGLGQSATCTIIYNDRPPVLTIVKQIVNDSGGSSVFADWTLSATGPTPLSGPGPSVSSGAGFKAGSYDLSESGPTGYTASAWLCSGATQNDNDTVTVALGQSATCTITNDDDEASLTLVKQVTNNNGGTATPTNWILSATGPSPFSGPGPSVSGGVGFKAGTYNLAESGGPDGYAASAWVCAGGTQNDSDTVTVGLGQSVTCTIANNDVAPSLTLITQIINDNGGTSIAPNWTLTASGPSGFSGPGPSVSNNSGFKAGTYNLSESGPSGYTASAWVCTGGTQNDSDTITLSPGQAATCTIINNDDAPSLTLNKTVINDNGGAATAAAWTLAAAGPSPFSGSGPSVSNGPGFKAGTYNLSESGGPQGYSASAWVCSGGTQNDSDTITVNLGQTATCAITNNDQTSGLTLAKQVTNDNGGSAVASDWTLSAAGPSPFSGPGPSVSNGPGFKAGTYNLSESGGPASYNASNWVCIGGTQTDGDTVIVGLGESPICTISNNDQAPSLTLVKQVINDNGGGAIPANWTLSASGPSPFSGAGPIVSSGLAFKAGTYTLAESAGPDGYTAGSWSCNGGIQNGSQITLGLGESATCTITNNDTAPSLTLVKQVTNNNGGSAVAANWTLAAAGPSPFSGPGPSVSNGPGFVAGAYTLSESTGPNGYTASAWVCVGGSQDGSTINVQLGEAVTCTITNNDNAPSLALNKAVTNDNGGTATASAWTLAAAGPTPISGPGADGAIDVQSGPSFAAGAYTLSESGGPNGYNASAWSCNGGIQNGSQITLGLGESATCTITNNDTAPSLTLVKQVTNNNGGSAVAANWTLAAAGPSPFSGPGPSVSNGPGFKTGTYDLSESGGPSGYSASAWNCTAGSMIDADTVSLALGVSATCTIVNDDDGAGLTLNKVVINDNGGTAIAADWTLTATGPTGFSGPGPSVSNGPGFVAGSYDLSESAGPNGYTAGAWVCVGGSQDDTDTITVAPGEAATCTITNNDNAPSLTLAKTVINNNGGTASPSAWTLVATGPSSFSGAGPSVSNGPGFKAGTYDLSESGGPSNYTASAWVCTGVSQDDADTVTLAIGATATCTITNDDKAQGTVIFKNGFESN